MKISALMFAACLALAATQVSAREPKAPPSPLADEASTQPGMIKTAPNPTGYGATNLYVGKYGETIEVPYNWTAKVETRNETEAVYFHRKFSDDRNLIPFNPKPADYKVENFARLELMELVVIPKNAPGGFRSLDDLRAAKEKEAATTGAKITVEENRFAWPRGTFRVRAIRPHRVLQIYTESRNEFLILTSAGYLNLQDFGPGEKRMEAYNYAIRRAEESLRKHVIGSSTPAPSSDEGSGKAFIPIPASSRDYLANFRAPRFIGMIGTMAAVMLVLAFWPGTNASALRARLYGRSVFLGAHLTALAGFLTVFVPIIVAGMRWRNASEAVLLPLMAAPLACGLAARVLGLRVGRVVLATGALAAIEIACVLLSARPNDLLPPEYAVLGNTVLLYIAGIAFGIAFALSCGALRRTEESR